MRWEKEGYIKAIAYLFGMTTTGALLGGCGHYVYFGGLGFSIGLTTLALFA